MEKRKEYVDKNVKRYFKRASCRYEATKSFRNKQQEDYCQVRNGCSKVWLK